MENESMRNETVTETLSAKRAAAARLAYQSRMAKPKRELEARTTVWALREDADWLKSFSARNGKTTIEGFHLLVSRQKEAEKNN